MGQYWKPVNLDKKQFVNPHKLGTGLKLLEQLAGQGVGQALVILLAAMPEARGGGDLNEDPIIGSWVGDRVVLIGDYAEDGDLPNSDIPASELYSKTNGEPPEFTDVTDAVCAVIERELGGKFTGTGWRTFEEA